MPGSLLKLQRIASTVILFSQFITLLGFTFLEFWKKYLTFHTEGLKDLAHSKIGLRIHTVHISLGLSNAVYDVLKGSRVRPII